MKLKKFRDDYCKLARWLVKSRANLRC